MPALDLTAMSVKHSKVSDKPDSSDASRVNASDWNDAHVSDNGEFSTTGDFKFVMRAAAPAGWVAGNGGTIGNASSGATRANADTQALFTAWWTDYTDAQLPILTSSGAASTRGASAAADWTANKRLTVFDVRDRVPRAAGSIQSNGEKLEATRFYYDNLNDAIVRVAHAGTQPINPDALGSDSISVAFVNGSNSGAATSQATAAVRAASLGMLGCFKL